MPHGITDSPSPLVDIRPPRQRKEGNVLSDPGGPTTQSAQVGTSNKTVIQNRTEATANS
jgi:hypothetical protein